MNDMLDRHMNYSARPQTITLGSRWLTDSNFAPSHTKMTNPSSRWSKQYRLFLPAWLGSPAMRAFPFPTYKRSVRWVAKGLPGANADDFSVIFWRKGMKDFKRWQTFKPRVYSCDSRRMILPTLHQRALLCTPSLLHWVTRHWCAQARWGRMERQILRRPESLVQFAGFLLPSGKCFTPFTQCNFLSRICSFRWESTGRCSHTQTTHSFRWMC